MTAAVPGAATLLAAWETGAAVAAVARGATALQVLAPSAGTGAMDVALTRLAVHATRCRAEVFGPDVDGVVECSACGARLAVTVRLDELVPAAVPDVDSARTVAGLTVRPPTVRDLVAAERGGREALLARCVTAEGGSVDVASLTEAELQEIDELLERTAGDALPVLRTSCSDCGADVAATVDAAGLLWEEVVRLVPQLLDDVARLAAAFGWSEQDVLAMNPVRRTAYLRLVSP